MYFFFEGRQLRAHHVPGFASLRLLVSLFGKIIQGLVHLLKHALINFGMPGYSVQRLRKSMCVSQRGQCSANVPKRLVRSAVRLSECGFYKPQSRPKFLDRLTCLVHRFFAGRG